MILNSSADVATFGDGLIFTGVPDFYVFPSLSPSPYSYFCSSVIFSSFECPAEFCFVVAAVSFSSSSSVIDLRVQSQRSLSLLKLGLWTSKTLGITLMSKSRWPSIFLKSVILRFQEYSSYILLVCDIDLTE